MQVRWQSSLSEPFGVSNGVWQGGVLSPILFTVYIDDLLLEPFVMLIMWPCWHSPLVLLD